MTSIYIAIPIILIFLISGISCPKNTETPPESPTTHTFAIQNHTFEIRLPNEYETRFSVNHPESANAGGRTIRFAIPGTRAAHHLEFRPIAPDETVAIPEPVRTVKLNHGGLLHYSVERSMGGGSGGTEGRLLGVIRYDDLRLSVECADQDEPGPKPEWCVPYLHHLRRN